MGINKRLIKKLIIIFNRAVKLLYWSNLNFKYKFRELSKCNFILLFNFKGLFLKQLENLVTKLRILKLNL